MRIRQMEHTDRQGKTRKQWGKKRESLYLFYIVLTGHLDHRILTPLQIPVGSY